MLPRPCSEVEGVRGTAMRQPAVVGPVGRDETLVFDDVDPALVVGSGCVHGIPTITSQLSEESLPRLPLHRSRPELPRIQFDPESPMR